MTKETVSTFLPIVNIWIRAKSVKSKASNPRNKTPENQRSFPAANPIPRNWQPAKLNVNHLRCLTFGSPLSSSMCRVSTVYAHRIFVWLGRFSKIRFFIRFWTMEKKKSENEEKLSLMVGLFVILDNVPSSRSWSPENWRLMHNQSRSVQTHRSFNQLISNHLKDFILDDIQTINFLPSCLYHMVLSRSRSPKRLP